MILSEQIANKSKNACKKSEEVEKAMDSLEKSLKKKRIANTEQKNDIEELEGKRFKSD